MVDDVRRVVAAPLDLGAGEQPPAQLGLGHLEVDDRFQPDAAPLPRIVGDVGLREVARKPSRMYPPAAAAAATMAS